MSDERFDEETVSETGGMEADDPESYFSTRRLRTIHDARDRAREVRSAVRDPTADIDGQAANRYYRVEVENYLSEIEPLAMQALQGDTPDDELVEIWYQRDLGTIVIDPPQELLEREDDSHSRVIGTPDLSPARHSITGLGEYLDAPSMFVEEYTLHIRDPSHGKKTLTDVAFTEIPIDVSHEAFRAANLFLAKLGLHVEVAESEHRAVVDEDVLEEVEKWRKQNINR